ncbi:hypothetical protein ONZ45_g4962 [Pleurotus djamor]|nr:hypothetical protein ONZ45_g4962 [Pleurotus djamor]
MISPAEFLKGSPTLKEVKQKIKSLREDIRVLQRYRNARHTLVSRLPPEILSKIFEEMVFAIPRVLPGGTPKKPHRYWLSVTQVCHLWRKIAIDSPRLWTLVYTYTNKAFAKLCVERSKGLPLYLATYAAGTHNEKTIEYLLGEHAARLWRLELWSCHSSCVDMLVFLNAPILKELILTVWHSQGMLPRKVSFRPSGPGDIPPLRYISLTDCSLDLGSSFLSQLRTLKMCHRVASDPSNISPREVLLALKNLSHLELLELDSVIDGASDDFGQIFVELPRLHTLLLGVTRPAPLGMLANLSLPSIRSILLSIAMVTSTAMLVPVLEAFYSKIPNPRSPHARVDVTAKLPMSTSTMNIWPSQDTEGDAPYKVSIDSHPDFSTSSALFSLFSNLPPPILTLSLGQQYKTDAGGDARKDLKDFLRSLTPVEEIYAQDFDDLRVLLSDTPKPADANTPLSGGLPAFSLPSLKNILLYDTETYMLSNKGKMFKEVVKYLKGRQSISAGIETFRIICRQHCLPMREAEPLRKQV